MKWLIIIGAIVFIGGILFLFRKNWGAFFRFLVSKLFLINLALAVTVGFMLPYCSLQGLDETTQHGVKVETPYVIGVNVSELDEKFKGTQVNYQIIDSTYSDDYPAGSVIQQDPNPKINYDSVKPGRTIYLSIVKKGGEYKEVPNYEGLYISKDLAKMKLESRGFKVSFTSKPAKNDNVIALEYKGKVLKGGEKLLKGSLIEVVHGSGQGGEAVDLPSVKGLSAIEANNILSSAGLIVEIHYEPEAMNQADSSNFVISSQNPSPGSVPMGIVASGSTVSLIATKPEASAPVTDPQ